MGIYIMDEYNKIKSTASGKVPGTNVKFYVTFVDITKSFHTIEKEDCEQTRMFTKFCQCTVQIP